MYPYQAPIKVFATPGSDMLAKEICYHLQPRIDKSLIPYPDGNLRLGKVTFEMFSNENLEAQVENVRDTFVVVVHTQVPRVWEHFGELLALLDALVNADAADILLVLPYMPFSRSDRKNKSRISTMGCRFPRIIGNEFNISRVLLLDPHDTHIKHYFPLKAANEISATYLFVAYVEQDIFSKEETRNDWVIVFADANAAKKFDHVAHLLQLDTAYIDKRRPDNTERPKIKRFVGELRKKCIMIDDEIATASTALKDAELLISLGVEKVIFMAIHADLRDKSLTQEQLMEKVESSPIDRFIVSNSIPVEHKIYSKKTKFTVLNVGPLLAEAISRLVKSKPSNELTSLSALHKLESVSLYRSF